MSFIEIRTLKPSSRKGPREAMLALIESYVDTVFEVDESTVQGLRKSTKI